LQGLFPNHHFYWEKGEYAMPALNRVQLIGRLGKDPESRFTSTGKNVARFSLAVSNRWKSGEGETRENTEWVNIEAWGRLGEICQQYLHKGSLVFIEGRLKTDKFDDKSGETKYYTKVVAISMQMLDRKPEEEPVSSVEDEAGDYEA
jgi:single-strand DNA-binding protein